MGRWPARRHGARSWQDRDHGAVASMYRHPVPRDREDRTAGGGRVHRDGDAWPWRPRPFHAGQRRRSRRAHGNVYRDDSSTGIGVRGLGIGEVILVRELMTMQVVMVSEPETCD